MKLAVGALLLVVGLQQTLAAYKTVCYFSSWAHYRNGNGRLSSEDIDPNLCTHLVYAFAGLNNDYTVHTLDAWLSEDSGLGDYRKFTGLKSRNSNLKTLIGIGGWNEDVARLSRMASTPRNRQTFINSVLEFLEDFDFDGLNLDWQYPANRGGLPIDKRNFIELLKELRQAFDKRGYVLGTSAAGNLDIINTAYDIPKVTEYVDYVSLLTYDYHGSWDTRTGHNAPLYPQANSNAVDRNLCQDATVSLWLKKGADASKILLGIPAYGRTFTLRTASRNRIGDSAIAPGRPGPYTQQGGYLGYNEIIELFEYEDGWTVEFDDVQKVAYAYKDEFWIGFDNIQSVGVKAEYIKNKQLGGAMFWSLETEDFTGLSGTVNPLVNAVQKVLSGGNPITQGTTKERQTTTPSGITTPKVIPNRNECKKEGVQPHSTDCTKYVTCIKVGRDGLFQQVVNVCPAGLAFDESISACNWRDAVSTC